MRHYDNKRRTDGQIVLSIYIIYIYILYTHVNIYDDEST
jgi:hypothetical protein